MAKYYGLVGFAEYVELPGSITEERIVTHPYYGDVLRNIRRYESADQLHDNLTINNEFSIIADAYAYENFHNLKFIEYMGTRWKAASVTVERPRLLISVGGVYNGPKETQP